MGEKDFRVVERQVLTEMIWDDYELSFFIFMIAV
jgi:hypothetical protein